MSIGRGVAAALAITALSAPQEPAPPVFELQRCLHQASGEEVLCGKFPVYENRAAGTGRRIELQVVVLPARSATPAPDPLFYLAGGPGQGATQVVGSYLDSWIREERDIVFVDQRGTGRSHPLRCAVGGGDADLQSYLEPIFREEVFRPCLESLQEEADLRRYTTPVAMDDLNAVREALGYEQINLAGGSYGTRACLVYLRRHPETVRSVILNGVAPVSFLNPLYHARSAQDALDLLFDECAADPACARAFPNVREEFQAVLARLGEEPARVELRTGDGGAVTLLLSRDAFAEALRVLMYSSPRNRRVPLLIHRAYEGDFRPFARLGLQTNRALRDMLSFGMLLCVTCSEDLPRIEEDAIERETAGTFLGDGRVRGQRAVCAWWPRGEVPDDYGEPVVSDVPVLLLSGTLDPVTPPAWGEEAARHLSNSLHLVVPGAHGVGGPCLESIQRAFLRTASVADLDTTCVARLQPSPFVLED